ncbi:MAG: sulfite exporter TauE/SafE family protein [Caldilineaceae bacterium]|nr:sulfite exporter TauE/SafE family protein [Caldilineaceae bacterium]
MLEFFLAFLVGCFAGVMTGLMGASGMMAVVPGMILLGYTPYQAIGVSLAVDVIAASVVAVAYYRNGRVDLRRGIWIALAAVIGAQVGSRLLFRIPADSLTGGFSALLLVTAVTFWREGIGQGGVGRRVAQFQRSTLSTCMAQYPVVVSILIGLVVGTFSGMFGVGGGILFMFALLILGYGLHAAVGTSTMIMALTTISGTIGHAVIGNLPYEAIFFAAIGTVLGSLASARLANRLSEAALSKAIAIVFAILGVALLLATFWQRS